ncbi:MAG: hypothetical protein KDA88_14565 [Planctomycetaceae bacterium]|nr:hypothetical protein [Planctomycetaceae bacterium]MCB9950809.1 hypothetical protein [Planctomycetaceae bacterium]
MISVWIGACVVALVCLVVCLLLTLRVQRSWKRSEELRALERFSRQREELEAKFFQLAAASGKPRGLRWIGCDWKQSVTFARDVQSGLISAFAGIEIRFEAIAGSEMEEVAAVGDVRDASAVFHYQNGSWGTGGKALFNMPPELAIERLAGQFTPLDAPPLK